MLITTPSARANVASRHFLWPRSHPSSKRRGKKRDVMKTLLSAVPLLAILCLSAFAQTPADTILVNGKILTVDDRFSTQEAIAIKEGKIVALGKTADIRKTAGSNT